MHANKGWTQKTHTALLKAASSSDRAWEERIGALRRRNYSSTRHQIVTIASRKGQTDDIVTGLPPRFTDEARAEWARRREEAEMERLFK